MSKREFESMEADDWEDLVRNDEGTRQARKALGAEVILDLDTTVTLDQYEGLASPELVAGLASYGEIGGEAWRLAFVSYLEAAMVAQELSVYENIEAVVDLIRWCRRAVGLSEEFATSQWGRFCTTKNPDVTSGLLIPLR